jgi:hypothetical protein
MMMRKCSSPVSFMKCVQLNGGARYITLGKEKKNTSTCIYFTLDSYSKLKIKNMVTIAKFGIMFYKLNISPVSTRITNSLQRRYQKQE